MKRKSRVLVLPCIVLLVLVLLTAFAFYSFAAEGTTITYEFDKQISALPGYGAGRITITPGTDSRKTGWYVICCADADGGLGDHEPIASAPIVGKTVTVEMPYGMYLPEKATQIVLFEGAVKGLDTSDISKAVDSFDLPAKKILTLSRPDLIFASVSDVHMNYHTSYGASAKWTAALNFFEKQGVEMVVVSGDLTDLGGITDYNRYTAAVSASTFPIEKIYESKGNHDSVENDLFMKTTKGEDQIHPYENSPYFHLLKKGEGGAKDNLFIFMAQELTSDSTTASQDNFSAQQLDWLEDLLIRYSGTNTNIFIIEHDCKYDRHRESKSKIQKVKYY